MNRILTLFTVGLLLLVIAAGCSQDARTLLKNKAIVMQGLRAFDDHQYDRLGEFFAQDLKRHCQATPDVEVNSLDDMIAFVKTWYVAFPDAKMDIRMSAAEGDLVAVWGTFTGTHQAPMGDIPATGKRMESETFGFFRIENGKIAEIWVTWDNVAILKQLGLMPMAVDETPDDL